MARRKNKWFPRDYDKLLTKFDKRTPGFFKEEYSSDYIVALSSEIYYCGINSAESKPKIAAKGVVKSINYNIVTLSNYLHCLDTKSKINVTNKDIRFTSNSMITYSTNKTGLTYLYDKCIVLEDGISTVPLSI